MRLQPVAKDLRRRSDLVQFSLKSSLQAPKPLLAFFFSLIFTFTTAGAVDLNADTHQAVPGDFNGDGRIDALMQPLLAGGDGAILLRDGTGNLSVLAQGWAPGYLGLDWSADKSAITTADLNGDGQADVIIQPRSAGNNASVLITDPTAQLLKVEQVIPAGYLGFDWAATGHFIVPGDFDGDRQKELLLQAVKPGDPSAIVHADAAGHLVAISQPIPDYYLGRRWNAEDVTLYVGDFNGDGRQDLLMQVNAGAEKAGEPTYALLLADPNGQFTQIAQVWNSSDFGADWSPATHTLSLQDLNGNGVMDIVLTSKDPNGTNYVFAPNSQGLFEKPAAKWTGPESARSALAKQQNGSRGISVVMASTTSTTTAAPSTAQTQAMMQTAMVQSAMVGGTQAANTVGSMAGQSGVEGGSATYSLPIAVPPGIAGMQPSLSLNYSSHGGNGELGMGWSLSGTSSIHRCPATEAQDGYSEGVTYSQTDDRLCLDGQHLIAITGTYGASGAVYRTERDTFVRITQLGGALNSISTYFEVDYEDGRTSYYGLPGSASAFVAQWPGNTTNPILVWAVTRTDDLAGNNITYSYRGFGNGEYHLSAIYYTGKTTGTGAGAGASLGSREVDFSYTTRPDLNSTYLAGGRTDQTQLLTKITTKVNGTEVDEYDLGYSPSAATGRSLLRSAQECGYAAGSSAIECLPIDNFTWQEPPLSYTSPTVITVPAGIPTGTGSDSTTGGQITAFKSSGDYNGDGTNEMFYDFTDGFAFSGDGKVEIDLGAIFPAPNSTYLGTTEDFMRNGLAEPLGEANPTSPTPELMVATCNYQLPCTSQANFTTVTSTGIKKYGPSVWVTGDFTGDGLPDILADHMDGSGNHAIYLYRNTTGAAGTKPSFDTAGANLAPLSPVSGCTVYGYQTFAEAGDLDGNGTPDLFLNQSCSNNGMPMAVAFIDPTSSGLTATVKNLSDIGIQQFSSGPDGFYFADINGDGLKDFVYAGLPDSNDPATGPTWHYQINQGGTFAPEKDTGVVAGNDNPTAGTLTPFSEVKVGDFTGEGRDELMVPVEMTTRYCETELIKVNGSWEPTAVCGDDVSPADNHSFYQFKILKFVEQADGSYLPTWVTGAGGADVSLVTEAHTTSTAELDGSGFTDVVLLATAWFTDGRFNESNIVGGCTAGVAPCEALPVTLGYYYSITPTGGAPDLMTGAVNGLGAQATWQYDSLAHLVGSGAYTVDDRPCNTATNINKSGTSEYYCFSSTMWVVTNYQVSNGIGGVNTYTYQYANAVYEDEGRGFQGFQSITVIDKAAGTQTVNTYHQDFPLSGMLVESQVSTTGSNSVLLSDTKDSWTSASPAGCLASSKVFWPQLQKSTITRNNTDGSQISQGVTQYTYDADGNTKTVDATTTDAAGAYSSNTTHNYNPSDCTNWWTDQLSQKIMTTSVTYNPGFLAATPPAASSITRTADYTYNTGLRKVATEDDDKGATLAANGASNEGISLEKDSAYTYDAFGNLATVNLTSPDTVSDLVVTFVIGQDYGFKNELTTTTYTADGYFAKTVTDPMGLVTSVNGNDPGTGQPTSVTAPDGVTVTHSYDAFGRPTRGQIGDMNPISITYGNTIGYCGSGVYMVTTAQVGNTTKYACFDMLNRQVHGFVDGFGGGNPFQTGTAYDALGRVSQVTEPYSQQDYNNGQVFNTVYTYDVLNRIKDKKDAKGVDATYNYGVGPTGANPLATQIVVTPPAASLDAGSGASNGQSYTTYEIHDSLGKLLSTRDANTSETDFYYDAGGNPVLIRDAAGNQTVASYNALGQKISVTDPDQGISTFVYDVLGEVVQQTDAKGQQIQPIYDRDKRVKERFRPEGVSIWCYDGATVSVTNPLTPGDCSAAVAGPGTGKVSAMVQYDGYQETYGYNADGLLASTVEKINGNSYVTTTSYDSDGRVSAVSYPATIADAAPTTTASASATTVLVNSAPVTLTGIASDSDSTSTTSMQYQWTVVSTTCGCAPALSSTNTLTTQFTPSTPGIYTFRFTADDGLQAASSQVTVTVQPGPPGTIGTSESSSYNGAYGVSWGPATDAVGYNLYQSTDGGNTYAKVPCPPYCSGTSASFTGMGSQTSDITYTYKATGYANGVEGPAGNTANVVVAFAPTEPTPNTLPAQSNGDRSFTVSWGASTGVNPTYHVQLGKDIGTGTPQWTGGQCSTQALSCTVTPTVDGTFYAKVESCNLSTCNAYVQAPGSVNVWHLTPPAAPSLSETDASDGIHYTVSWNAPATATYYNVWFSSATKTGGYTTPTEILSNYTTTSYYTKSGFAQYYLQYAVQACNSAGCSGQSVPIQFMNPQEVTGCTTCAKINAPGPTTTSAPASATSTPGNSVRPMAPATGPTAMVTSPGMDRLLASRPIARIDEPAKMMAFAPDTRRSAAREAELTTAVNEHSSPSRQRRSRTKAAFWYAPQVYAAYADTQVEPASGTRPIVGLTVQYHYNGNGYLNQVVDASNPNRVFWQATGINARQEVTDEIYGVNNGVTAITGHRDYYGDSGLVQDIQSGTGTSTGTGTASSLQNLHYDWQSYGNLDDRQDLRQGVSEAFQYDVLNRLTNAQVTNGAGAQPALSYAYDALGNITCKSDVTGNNCLTTPTGYIYGQGGEYPHAVSQIKNGSGTIVGSYVYDADGNMACRDRVGNSCTPTSFSPNIVWNSDNLPTQITQDANNTSQFSYAPDKHRYYQTSLTGGQTETTIYAGGLEIVTDGTGTSAVTHNRYQVSAYGRSVAVVDLESDINSNPVINTQYLLTDNLGSVDGATDASGNLTAGTGWSFEAFGKRRDPATWQTPQSSAQIATDRSAVTNRGYTGHEMLDNVALVHMNGRVYDPVLGRFLSVDPVFQFPTNTQSLNPYSYVLNNPLSATDPTGYTENCTAGQTTGCPPQGQKNNEYGSKSGESSRIHEGHENANGMKLNALGRSIGFVFDNKTVVLGGTMENGAKFGQDATDAQTKSQTASSINSPGQTAKQGGESLEQLSGMSSAQIDQIMSSGPLLADSDDFGGNAAQEWADAAATSDSVLARGFYNFMGGLAVLGSEDHIADTITVLTLGEVAARGAGPSQFDRIGPKTGSSGGPGSGKDFSQSVKDAARNQSGNTCVFCGTKTIRSSSADPARSNIDHAIPKFRGGNNTLENAQNTCQTCNLQKGARTTDEYLRDVQKGPGG